MLFATVKALPTIFTPGTVFRPRQALGHTLRLFQKPHLPISPVNPNNSQHDVPESTLASAASGSAVARLFHPPVSACRFHASRGCKWKRSALRRLGSPKKCVGDGCPVPPNSSPYFMPRPGWPNENRLGNG